MQKKIFLLSLSPPLFYFRIVLRQMDLDMWAIELFIFDLKKYIIVSG
jgi:hypothetical protein